MEDKSWANFWNSGSVYDYLDYKENEKAADDDGINQRIGNKGADNRGE